MIATHPRCAAVLLGQIGSSQGQPNAVLRNKQNIKHLLDSGEATNCGLRRRVLNLRKDGGRPGWWHVQNHTIGDAEDKAVGAHRSKHKC